MPEKQRQCQEEKPEAKAVGRRKAFGGQEIERK